MERGFLQRDGWRICYALGIPLQHRHIDHGQEEESQIRAHQTERLTLSRLHIPHGGESAPQINRSVAQRDELCTRNIKYSLICGTSCRRQQHPLLSTVRRTENAFVNMFFFSQIKLHTSFSENAFVNMISTNETTHCFFQPDYCVFVIYNLFTFLSPLALYSLHIPTTRLRTASIILYKIRTCVHKHYLNLAAWKSDHIHVRNAQVHV